MTITARVQNHSIPLPEELSVAEGTEVQITLPEPTGSDTALTPRQIRLLALVDELHGSISLPSHLSDKELIAQARIEKYERGSTVVD